MPQEALRAGGEPELPSWSLPGLRLVTVPGVGPPYDEHGPDEHGPGEHGPDEHGAGAAPGERRPPDGLQPDGLQPPDGRRLPGGAARMALALVIVEVLAGVRPERQLVPLATDRVRARVRALGPVLGGAQRPRIKRVRACQPAPHVVEMAVVVTAGPRARALALRLEHTAARAAAPGQAGRPARWRCTALEVG